MVERSTEAGAPAPLPGPFSEWAFTWTRLFRDEDNTTGDPIAFKILVASLFASPASIIPGMIGCLLTPLICWLATQDPAFLLFTALAAASGAVRLAIAIAYWSADHDDDEAGDTLRWDRAFALSASLTSATLGANCYYALIHNAEPAAQITAAAANIALAAGFVARNAARPRFVILQILFFCVPLVIGLMRSPNPHFAMLGWFTLFFVYGNIGVVFSIHRNLLDMISAMKKSDALAKELQKQNAVLDAALNHMSHGLAMFDKNMNLAVTNRRHVELYQLSAGNPAATLRGTTRDLSFRRLLSAADAGKLDIAAEQVLRSGAPATQDVAIANGANYVVTLTPAADQGVVMLTEDATQRKASAAKIEKLARFDTLTGLANRYEITQIIEDACHDLERPDHHFALLFIDLDGFKAINDTLGHYIGDKLLVAVAQRISEFHVGANVFGRLGGDEFIAFLPRAGRNEALALAMDIIGRLTETFVIDQRQIRVSASIGIALAPEHDVSVDHLLRDADLALYRAKSKGRGAAAIYDEALASEISQRHSTETALRLAIAAKAFEMHYQPIVDLRTQKVAGHEALMRWSHSTRGRIDPQLFISVAEDAGLIDKLGCFAITQSCLDAASWPDEQSISVNVSPIQFRNPDLLIEAVAAGLAKSKLNPRRLILEMTESALVGDAATTRATMNKIAALGVRFALDDFGTGYSSLSTLSNFPFSFIKIDRSLSCKIAVDPTQNAIVEAVCQLARKINLEVVVEGVETDEQRLVVQLMGAHKGQGWLFGKPVAAPKIARNLRGCRSA